VRLPEFKKQQGIKFDKTSWVRTYICKENKTNKKISDENSAENFFK